LGRLDDFLGLFNSLVEEKADILKTEKVSVEEEIEFLSKVLTRLEKDEMFYLVAEVDGKVVAVSEITKRTGYEKNLGVIGIVIRIVIRRGFRDLGIGTEIMKTLRVCGSDRIEGLNTCSFGDKQVCDSRV